ncbi:hypothetical protein GCM10011613_05890 [Cellvibrio zantedeschiae]|uniref:DUF4177 domain-containing protein n=1 Tax=Cellvibrio zantedeschiae TaxID=1237077 RepID=A0ABQ3AS55_9GAMM|nr:DUF4177 domain-containing protein [Cellvibrio zantedeschiae]GGY64903.1 hypothetical protein GCM10011613_05890 [Cellvibrio zantedeschiae]
MRWEYKTIEVKRKFMTGGIDVDAFEEQLNTLGLQGWELVSVNQNQMHSVVAVLKRAK